jgi:hexokinase
VPNLEENKRLRRRPANASVAWRQGRRPWRVLPLALFAVVATTATMGAATHLFWQMSGHRYAGEILRQHLHQIHAEVAARASLERAS